LTEELYITISGTTPKYHYYLRDHEGNNRVVLNQSGTVEQVNHYYPFGGLMGESTAGGVQPYKYNGKELDRMHGLDLFDYGARHYDAALGRWFVVDPLAEKYYSISQYAYVGNNPVNAVDLRGDSITTIVNTIITNPDGTTSLQSTQYNYGQNPSGTYGFIDSSGNLYSGTDAFVNSLTTALNDLRTGGNVGSALVSDLVSSTKNVQIIQGKNTADPNGTYIKWNPNSTEGGINPIGTVYRPAYIGLGHEMAHIQDIWKGTYDNTTWIAVGGFTIPNAEKYATHIENQLRAENNISLRTHYAYGIDASSGKRVGLESTRIINGNLSLFYNQSNGKSPMGIPLLSTPFIYKKR
jgi:RHS repeat-associated protein